VLGEGGMGTVYEAEHLVIGRLVALKVLHPGFTSESEAVRRFRHEARAAGSIGHPNICEIYDVGELEDGGPYLVMERLHGETLADRIERDIALPLADVVDVALQVLSALAAAHEKGIVHRDVKPDNIFLAQRVGFAPLVKLLDFGISKNAALDDLRLTRTGAVMGTPYYMAPEQARGEFIDARIDLYAVGAVLYESLTGRRPFDANELAELLRQVLFDEPRPMRDLRPSVPRPFEFVVRRALAKERTERFQTAPEFMAALAGLRVEIAAYRPNPSELDRLVREVRQAERTPPQIGPLTPLPLAPLAGRGTPPPPAPRAGRGTPPEPTLHASRITTPQSALAGRATPPPPAPSAAEATVRSPLPVPALFSDERTKRGIGPSDERTKRGIGPAQRETAKAAPSTPPPKAPRAGSAPPPPYLAPRTPTPPRSPSTIPPPLSPKLGLPAPPLARSPSTIPPAPTPRPASSSPTPRQGGPQIVVLPPTAPPAAPLPNLASSTGGATPYRPQRTFLPPPPPRPPTPTGQPRADLPNPLDAGAVSLPNFAPPGAAPMPRAPTPERGQRLPPPPHQGSRRQQPLPVAPIRGSSQLVRPNVLPKAWHPEDEDDELPTRLYDAKRDQAPQTRQAKAPKKDH
jgi:serine/threonine protein kinase